MPTKTVSAQECALRLHEYFGHYGAPREITSDRGSQFVNELISEFLKSINVKHTLSIAYNHQDNSMVERQIREVRRHLRTILLERDGEVQWSEQLPSVQRIINSTVNSDTGYKPADMRFGQFNSVESHLFKQTSSYDSNTWVNQMREFQDSLIQQATTNQQASIKNKMDSNKSTPTYFKPGDYVLVEETTRRKGDVKDISRRGPFVVINQEGPRVVLRDPSKTTPLEIHVSRCTKYNIREGSDPLVEATRDSDVYIIDKILDHRITGKKMNKSGNNVHVAVQWRGYSDIDWQPLSNRSLRYSQAFVDYSQMHPELKSYLLVKTV